MKNQPKAEKERKKEKIYISNKEPSLIQEMFFERKGEKKTKNHLKVSSRVTGKWLKIKSGTEERRLKLEVF